MTARLTEHLDWEGIALSVTFCPDWSPAFREAYGRPLAHLTVASVAPKGAPLPITSTGYISRFLSPDDVAAHGGPAGYVRAWLDHAADDPAWRELQAKSVQLSLF